MFILKFFVRNAQINLHQSQGRHPRYCRTSQGNEFKVLHLKLAAVVAGYFGNVDFNVAHSGLNECFRKSLIRETSGNTNYTKSIHI